MSDKVGDDKTSAEAKPKVRSDSANSKESMQVETKQTAEKDPRNPTEADIALAQKHASFRDPNPPPGFALDDEGQYTF